MRLAQSTFGRFAARALWLLHSAELIRYADAQGLLGGNQDLTPLRPIQWSEDLERASCELPAASGVKSGVCTDNETVLQERISFCADVVPYRACIPADQPLWGTWSCSCYKEPDGIEAVPSELCSASPGEEREQTAKIERVLQRQTYHKEEHQKQDMQKTEKLRVPRLEFEKGGEERRQKKVADLKAWLKWKEAEYAGQKQTQDDVLAKVKMQEEQKVEKMKQQERARLEERSRRLELLEQKKKMVEAQFANAPLKAGPQRPPKATLAMPELRKPMQPPRHQRVVHRHIDHHVHYHEGSEESEGEPVFAVSRDEQVRIEQASEARVRTQLEASSPPSFQYGSKKSDLHSHKPVDHFAVTPPMHGLTPLRMKGHVGNYNVL
mmetsp:Transcript_45602/g.102342  ORF Transcript_45602/g.102342 Transcript_45602/m.102342 type:complete len:380 (+) Transcript_45602:66-1205(+)